MSSTSKVKATFKRFFSSDKKKDKKTEKVEQLAKDSPVRRLRW